MSAVDQNPKTLVRQQHLQSDKMEGIMEAES
jgi:hypothetical protein